MIPYLHILIRVEEDGSLHALGAFTSKEKQEAYRKDAGLQKDQVRFDFYNGPFHEDIKVVYTGHRRWNMDNFQIGGYFISEGEAWNFVTKEGYVNVLRIDTTYEEERQFEKEALELYNKLQKRWRLSSYKKLVEAEGAQKARASITLRFYEDALESFKPKTRRDLRALYAFFVSLILLPFAIYFYLKSAPEYGENVPSVSWLPNYATDISFYKSQQIQVYEFKTSAEDFKSWAKQKGMRIQSITEPELLSRYFAYFPKTEGGTGEPGSTDSESSIEARRKWENKIKIVVQSGTIARGEGGAIAIYDENTRKAYYEQFVNL